MELDQSFDAVLSAEKAIDLDPDWAVAWQTLGRAQMNIGETSLVSYSSLL